MTIENMPDDGSLFSTRTLDSRLTPIDRTRTNRHLGLQFVSMTEQLRGELTTRRLFGPSYPMIRSGRQPVRGGHMSDRSEPIGRLVEIRRKPKRNRDSAAC